MCVQWRDKHDVRMLSSCIPDENVSVIRRGKEVIQLIINTCNNMMGGVYVIDQMMNLYPVDRKRFKKWYKKNVDSSYQFLCIQCSYITLGDS